METKTVKYTEEEIKKMKGATNWAVLIKNNKNLNKKGETDRLTAAFVWEK